MKVYSDLIPMEERQWAMLSHLSSLLAWVGIPFAHLLGPLIMWQIKKETMPFATTQAKECLNFKISMSIYVIVSLLLTVVAVGFLLLAVLCFVDLFFTVRAALKANNGVAYRYPITIRFLK